MDKIRFLVADDIKRVEQKLTNLFPVDIDVFWDLDKFLQEKSKRIRSVLALLYLKTNNVLIDDNVIKLLSAGELFHNASLLHDDVIDSADFRRGNITLNSKYNSKIAVLSGDYLLSFAVNYLISLKNQDVLSIFIDTTKKMSEAEIQQYNLRNHDVSLEEYLNIINGKTASLFEGIMESSAIIANIEKTKAGEFGRLFGMLFQINNDYSEASIKNDKENAVMTITNILGIEKTNYLKDNYKEKMRAILEEFSASDYKKGLEDLVNLI